MTTDASSNIVRILIAALGGEGGGVLMDWIVQSAWRKGFPVQATSVPGVAQRTGATTYYIELLPETVAPGAPLPIFSLFPAPGEVDLMVATELAEAVRAAGNGFITPETTHLIASTSRSFLMPEKMSMADGRLDNEAMIDVLRQASKQAVLFDAGAAAKQAGSIVNAVMLGAIAASRHLEIGLEDFVQAIEEEGKAVSSNIAGLRLGHELGRGTAEGAAPVSDAAAGVVKEADPTQQIAEILPSSLHGLAHHVVERLTDYQDAAYAGLYFDRLAKFKDADDSLLKVIARHLGARMSYEDIIRVAQAKIRAERLTRIRAETGAEGGDIIRVTEFFRPGIPEIADLMPIGIAEKLLARAERRGTLDKPGRGMELNSTTLSGFFKLWILAKLIWWRPRSYRWGVEQKNIEVWLNMVAGPARLNTEFAIAVADLARLIKGYGSTHRRGSGNYAKIVDGIVRPALEGKIDASGAAGQLNRALDAALADPKGTKLINLLTAPDQPAVAAE